MRHAIWLTLTLFAALGAIIMVAPASVASPGAPELQHDRALDKSAGSTLEGRWKTARATLQEMLAAGISRRNAEPLAHGPKHPGLDFHKGAFKGLDLDTGKVHGTGTYRLAGDIIRLVFRSGISVQLGRTYWLRWSVYRDRLTFSSVRGRRNELQLFSIKPWTRVR
jgi:hypothetical protein